MSTLIISLPWSAAGATVYYDYALTSDGHTVVGLGSLPSAVLPTPGRRGEVVALVPVAQLSWHALDLPKGVGPGSPRLPAILQGLLEDRLLDEPGQLHLAVGPGAVSGGKVWVTACNKGWLRGHLQALEAAERTVTRIVPEFSPEAGSPRMHVCAGDPPQLIITGEAAGGVMWLPLAAAALALIPAACCDENLEVLAEPGVAALAEQLLQRRSSLLTQPERWLSAARSSWDLAQFDLTSSGRTRLLKRWAARYRELLHDPSWRSARWGVILLLLAHLLGLNTWAWKEQSALRARRAALQGLLTEAFPQMKVVLDAPLQMKREVTALRQATGAISRQDMETMLAALGTAMPEHHSADAIDFLAGEARVKGLQLNSQEAAGLSTRLKAQGYSARLEADTVIIQQEVRP